jgi:hypothetical protein
MTKHPNTQARRNDEFQSTIAVPNKVSQFFPSAWGFDILISLGYLGVSSFVILRAAQIRENVPF